MAREKDIQHGQLFKGTTMGILTTIISGLVIYLGAFFNQEIPKMKQDIRGLELKVENIKQDTHHRLDSIDGKVQKIYEILIDKGK